MTYRRTRGGVYLPDIWVPRTQCDLLAVNNLGGFGRRRSAGAAYSAAAVHFDGTNDWLLRGAELSGNADTKVGTISFFFKFNSDSTFHWMFGNRTAGSNRAIQVHRDTTNDIFIGLRNAPPANAQLWTHISTYTDYTIATGWCHFWAQWDLATPTATFNITRLSDGRLDVGSATVGPIDGTVNCTTGNFGVGIVPQLSSPFNGDMADAFFDNKIVGHAKTDFLNASNKPVNPLGKTGLVLLTGGDNTDWRLNHGSGGDFAETGDLTDASSSPSD